jgi:hypothetical protein
MSGRHCIALPAIDRRVTVAAYVAAVKRARAAPEATFKQGLESWWPTTGAEIRQQFRAALDRRIMRHAPHYGRGRKWGADYQRAAIQTAAKVNVNPRVIVREQSVDWRFRARLARRLTGNDEF